MFFFVRKGSTYTAGISLTQNLELIILRLGYIPDRLVHHNFRIIIEKVYKQT